MVTAVAAIADMDSDRFMLRAIRPELRSRSGFRAVQCSEPLGMVTQDP